MRSSLPPMMPNMEYIKEIDLRIITVKQNTWLKYVNDTWKM